MKHPEIWESVRTLMKFRNQAPPLKVFEKNGKIPLSLAQERLWLLEQLNSGSTAYNVPYALYLEGELNQSALEQSLNTIWQRHEALRTSFQEVEGKPVQLIAPAKTLTIPIIELQGLPENERNSKIEYLVKEEARCPFNFSRDSLFRSSLLKLGEREHILLLTFHHIVFDASSDLVLFRELSALYEAFCAGQPSPLPELLIQYSDFAIWQKQWLKGDFLDLLLNYWQEKLNGLETQQLPIDYLASRQNRKGSGGQSLLLLPSLVEQVNALTKEEGVTPFITFLSVFKVLLYYYLNREDIFVCTPTANRNRSEIQKQIGYFSNLLIQRTDLSGNPSFQEILARVRKGSSGAYAHQDLPIQLLVSELNLVNVSLSQILFGLDDFVERPNKLGNLNLKFLEEQRGTEFDWFLSLQPEEGTLKAVWKYNRELFEDSTIIQLLEHYQTVLERIVADPEQPISELLPLSETQKQEILVKLEQSRQLSVQQNKPQNQKNYRKPRNNLEQKLAEIWQQVLGIEKISITDNFFELGGKSLLAIRLINQIEEQLALKLPFSTLVKAPTIEELAQIISQDEVSSPWTPIVALQSQGSKTPLFFLPPAACTAMHFAQVAPYFAPEYPIYALEQLGLDGQQEPHQTVEEMASYYIEQIQTIQPNGPYFLLGRCMGGIVAFEMALQLQAKGEKIALLGIIDTQSPPRLQKRDFKYYLKEIYPRLKYYWQNPKFLVDFISSRIIELKQKVVPSNPQDIYIQKVMDTHTKARKQYIPKRIYQGRIDLFKNDEASMDVQAKWAELTTEGFNEHIIEGDHQTMLEEPHVQIFTEKLIILINQKNS
jgi:thioesterase domain-containing protein/acyl carrier protein